MDAVLRFALDPAVAPPAVDSLTAWWAATTARRAAWADPVDRAFAGGVCADRLGFAFAAGYAEALRALVPGLDGIAALCATEDGGAHPRAIRTSLTAAGPGTYVVSGRKRWATIASAASSLLVVATTGTDADGRNQLRVVRVAAGAPGVHLHDRSSPFIPEIHHAEVELDGVAVTEAALLPGDGYTRYLKPFRTIEDVHVHAALVGYLVGVTRRHRLPHALTERLLVAGVATRGLVAADVTSPVSHVVLAGLLELVARVVDDLELAWADAPSDEWTRWQRDRGLLAVARTARAARRERAWATLSAGDAGGR